MGLFGILVLGLVLILFLLAVMPVDLELDAAVGGKPRVRLGWLFGLVWKEVEGDGGKPGSEGKKDFKRGGEALVILRTEGFVRSVLKLIKRAVRSIEIRALRARLRFGFPDPADTGFVFAFLLPFLHSFPWDVRVEPSFEEEALEGRLQGAIRLWPFKIILSLLGFALSLPTLRAVKNLGVMKWKS